jgi:hypothetical protein
MSLQFRLARQSELQHSYPSLSDVKLASIRLFNLYAIYNSTIRV